MDRQGEVIFSYSPGVNHAYRYYSPSIQTGRHHNQSIRLTVLHIHLQNVDQRSRVPNLEYLWSMDLS